MQPLIELLMGGSGQARDEEIELSEIDEEVMHDIVQIVANEAQEAWPLPGLAVTAEARIAAAALQRFWAPGEKLTVLNFGVTIAESSGSLNLLMPSTFVTALLKQAKLGQSRGTTICQFPGAPFRERILESEMEVSAELTGLKVAVHDLVSLGPGSVLKSRALIQSPGMLSAGGRPIFEAAPVRSGLQRAAQLGQRVSQQGREKGVEIDG